MFEKIRELVKYKELLLNIVIREIKVRYKQSVLGIFWSILQPLSMMIVFTIVFSRVAKIPSDGIPYPLFSYTALLPWIFFATSLSFAISSLVSNASLLTKIYFPREIFPIASILAAFVDFCIAAVIFLAILVYYKVTFTMNAFYIIPILLIQVMITLAVSLFASAVNVYYRDVKYALPFIIQLWMYLSPVIYPVSSVPDKFRSIYMLNPMAPILNGYRNVLIVLAGIGRGQLLVLEDRVKARRANFEFYKEELGNLFGVQFKPEAEFGRSNCWLTCLTIDPSEFGATREDVRLALESENIEARPVWKPLHLQPVFKDCPYFGAGISEEIFDKGLCLPSGSNLSREDLGRVVDVIRKVYKKQGTEAG